MSSNYVESIKADGYYTIDCFKITEHRFSSLLSTKQYLAVLLIVVLSVLHTMVIFPFYIRALRNPENTNCTQVASEYVYVFAIGTLLEGLYMAFQYVKASKINETLDIRTELKRNTGIMFFGLMIGAMLSMTLKIFRVRVIFLEILVMFTIPVSFFIVNIFIPIRRIRKHFSSDTYQFSSSSVHNVLAFQTIIHIMEDEDCKKLFYNYLKEKLATESFNFIYSYKKLETETRIYSMSNIVLKRKFVLYMIPL